MSADATILLCIRHVNYGNSHQFFFLCANQPTICYTTKWITFLKLQYITNCLVVLNFYNYFIYFIKTLHKIATLKSYIVSNFFNLGYRKLHARIRWMKLTFLLGTFCPKLPIYLNPDNLNDRQIDHVRYLVLTPVAM